MLININSGHSEPVVSRCKKLREYSVFIAKVRECEAEIAAGRPAVNLTDDEKRLAMRKAIEWCIAHNTLKSFLEAHKGEVEDMLFDEWNLEDALVVEREEGREEGIEVGMERGIERNRAEVARTALAEGMSFDIICKLTGLDRAAIEHLSAEAGK
jgi:hypothetical protein